jgi:esterase
MKLHCREYGEGQPLLILHGLFGSSDNWQTLGKRLAEKYHVFLIDQRNHGHSDHSNDFSYELMADDLDEFITDRDLENVVLVGHSMGGKTAMTYAQLDDSRLSHLVVVDIGPKEYPMHHDQILEGMQALDFSIYNTRGKCQTKLAEYVPDNSVRQFLLKNLYWKEKGVLDWRINLHVIAREMENIISALEPEQVEVRTLFIRGERSNYIVDADYDSISAQFPDSEIDMIKNVGHWIHAEAPEEFYDILIEFIKQ